MQKINYQIELDKIIKYEQARGKTPTLLLHSCCGPCSSYTLEYLSNYFHITVLFYNPNIYPIEEYYFREKEQRQLIEKLIVKNPIKFMEGRFDPKEFYQAIKGFEKEPEGGRRCDICFRLRLDETGRIAEKYDFDYFTTTLSISPHKNSQILNSIGKEISEEVGVNYLYSDFKKRGGFQRSVELTCEFDMYRQEYCGCVFSKKEMLERNKKNSD